MSKATDILRKYSDYSDIAIDDALSAMREAMEEAFKAGIIPATKEEYESENN